MNFRWSLHAERECRRRQLSPDTVRAVLDDPEQIVAAHGQRRVYQLRVEMSGKMYLVRVIVDDAASPPVVLTVYRTSKIAKYWRPTP